MSQLLQTHLKCSPDSLITDREEREIGREGAIGTKNTEGGGGDETKR